MSVSLTPVDYGPVYRQISGELFLPISVSTSGDNIIVTNPGLGVPATSQIRVVKYSLVCAAPVILTWKSSISGAISGPMSFDSNCGISEPWCPRGIMQTAPGESLVLNLSGNVSVGGLITFITF